MASNDEILERLDKLVAIQQLVHREALENARVSIRADKVNAAILDATTKLTPAGKVVADVKKKTGQSPATISRRIASMELGVVEKQGGGPATQYRSTGLIHMYGSKELKEHLLAKLDVGPRQLRRLIANRAAELPSTNEQALYTLAHDNGLKLSHYLTADQIAEVRGLLQARPAPAVAPAKTNGSRAARRAHRAQSP